MLEKKWFHEDVGPFVGPSEICKNKFCGRFLKF